MFRVSAALMRCIRHPCEDIELTYRIARRYAIIFAPNVRVRHEFEPFWPVAKKYFLRAYYWTKLYQRRKKFDPVATTLQEALTTISGVGTVVMGIVWFILLGMVLALNYELRSMNYDLVRSNTFIILNSLFIILLVCHLFLTRKFLAFMVAEKGIVFAFRFLHGARPLLLHLRRGRRREVKIYRLIMAAGREVRWSISWWTAR